MNGLGHRGGGWGKEAGRSWQEYPMVRLLLVDTPLMKAFEEKSTALYRLLVPAGLCQLLNFRNLVSWLLNMAVIET